MKLSIVAADKTVVKDSVIVPDIDMSSWLPTDVWAVQWDSETSTGEIEYNDGKPNATISEIGIYSQAVTDFDTALPNSEETLLRGFQMSAINELRTVTYNWKASDKVDTSLPGYMHPDTTDFDKLSKDTSVTMNGLIAQEVKAALDKVGADASKYAVWSTDDDGIQRISESSFVMPLIKAVQELSAKVKALEDA